MNFHMMKNTAKSIVTRGFGVLKGACSLLPGTRGFGVLKDARTLLPETVPPPSINWKTKGVLSAVKDQKEAGCWLFASADAIEAKYKIVTGKGISLSLLDFKRRFPFNTRNGGSIKLALNFMVKHGLRRVEDYKKKKKTKLFTIKGYKRVNRDDEESFIRALSKQPLILSMGFNNSAHNYKAGEIYMGPYKEEHNHAIVAVAYDEETITLKNSHGTGFGDAGYMIIPRKVPRILHGPNRARGPAGIYRNAYYPILHEESPDEEDLLGTHTCDR